MVNIFQMMQMLQSGMNPQSMVQNMIRQNPQVAQIFQNVNINDPKSMEQVCRNACIQKGLDYETMLAQFRQNGGKL